MVSDRKHESREDKTALFNQYAEWDATLVQQYAIYQCNASQSFAGKYQKAYAFVIKIVVVVVVVVVVVKVRSTLEKAVQGKPSAKYRPIRA